MGIVADREFRYKCLTRAVFCVAKAQDTKDAATQRLSGLYLWCKQGKIHLSQIYHYFIWIRESGIETLLTQ